MYGVIQMQTFSRSSLDQSKLCSFDQEVIEAPTFPLIHQEARFLFVKQGRGTMTIQNKAYELGPNTFLAVLPWQITKIIAVEEPLQYYLVIYHLDTLDKFVKSFSDAEGAPVSWMNDIAASPVLMCDIRQAEALEQHFLALREELGMESILDAPVQRTMGNLAVINHLIGIVILYERFGMSSLPKFGESDGTRDRNEILRYISTHCNEKLTLKMLSRVFYICESSLSAYITSMTGLSYFDLINEMRIGKTANYLLYTDLTVEELSELMGYVDASHLSKVFSARVGMKINDYRKTYQTIGQICRIEEGREAYDVVAYIYRNYWQELNAQKVADKFSIRILKLHRILMYQVEKNFEEFLHFVRINRACELLLTTDQSITDIAIEVGYNSTKTFTRNFLRLKIMTPSDFRKNTVLQTKKA